MARFGLQYSFTFLVKVHIFWDCHKNMANSPNLFWHYFQVISNKIWRFRQILVSLSTEYILLAGYFKWDRHIFLPIRPKYCQNCLLFVGLYPNFTKLYIYCIILYYICITSGKLNYNRRTVACNSLLKLWKFTSIS